MSTDLYPNSTPQIQELRKALASEPLRAFHEFSRQAFAEGALSVTMKQIIAVAVAHTTQCPYCIRGHTAAALKAGASPEQIMEAIWVAAEMRAGAAYAHSTIALDVIQDFERRRQA
ncbi:MAG TPA: carboxymuconolactone decarboxylase family protein [Caulobacteraceae bacterium]